MKNFVRKLGFTWVVLAIIPLCSIVHWVLGPFGVDSTIILGLQIPLLTIQLSSLLIMIIYHKVIWGI